MDDFADRRAYFEAYLKRRAPEAGERFTCPCCAYPTLPDRGHYEICPLCGWEDDNQDDPDADQVWGGPNSDYSLSEARRNFAEHLTQYRVSDISAFAGSQSPGWLSLKRALMEVYGRMALAVSTAEHAALLAEEQAALDAMLALLRSKHESGNYGPPQDLA
jgi:hypothetical protein